jgi:hypothetical protein
MTSGLFLPFQFTPQSLLFLGEFFGYFDFGNNIEISFSAKDSSLAESLSMNFDHISYLRSLGHLDLHFTLRMIHGHFSSQDHIIERNIRFDIKIIAFPFKESG